MLIFLKHKNLPLKFLNDQIHQEFSPKKTKEIKEIILHVCFGPMG
jgi:hypothetical protein